MNQEEAHHSSHNETATATPAVLGPDRGEQGPAAEATGSQAGLIESGLPPADHLLEPGEHNADIPGDPETLAFKDAVSHIIEVYFASLEGTIATLEENIARPATITEAINELVAILDQASEAELDVSQSVTIKAVLTDLRNALAPQRMAAFMTLTAIGSAGESHATTVTTLHDLIDLETSEGKTGASELPETVLGTVRTLVEAMRVPEFSMTLAHEQAVTFDGDCGEQLRLLAAIERAAAILDYPEAGEDIAAVLSDLRHNLQTIGASQERQVTAASSLIDTFRTSLTKMNDALRPQLAKVMKAA